MILFRRHLLRNPLWCRPIYTEIERAALRLILTVLPSPHFLLLSREGYDGEGRRRKGKGKKKVSISLFVLLSWSSFHTQQNEFDGLGDGRGVTDHPRSRSPWSPKIRALLTFFASSLSSFFTSPATAPPPLVARSLFRFPLTSQTGDGAANVRSDRVGRGRGEDGPLAQVAAATTATAVVAMVLYARRSMEGEDGERRLSPSALSHLSCSPLAERDGRQVTPLPKSRKGPWLFLRVSPPTHTAAESNERGHFERALWHNRMR